MFINTTKKSVAGTVPKAMSIASVNFQVGQAAEEQKIAYGCPDCHSTMVWHDNAVNGPPGNHPARFDPDQCGQCHNYENKVNAISTGGTTYKVSPDPVSLLETFTDVIMAAGDFRGWKTGGNVMGFGASPISRRVHGVHAREVEAANNSFLLSYPFEVYNNENVTRIFPQDVRNCEKCHSSTTSGTWKTKPSRLACLSCHDSDAAYAHATTMTVDPTPAIGTTALIAGASAAAAATSGPYSGDEVESCPVCHAAKH